MILPSERKFKEWMNVLSRATLLYSLVRCRGRKEPEIIKAGFSIKSVSLETIDR